MEERQDLQRFPLSPKVIRQGFSNQLKELTLLNTHSPRIFIVYAHSLDAQEETEESVTFIAKQIQGYLQPTILAPCPRMDKHLYLNVYSTFSPQGNGSDSLDECKRTDVLYRQLGLLPKHAHSVDYVVVYGSLSLQEYCEIKEVKEYTYSLRRMLSAELSKSAPDFHELYAQVESALHVLKSRCSTEKQQFHSIYTELALLTLRKEERYKGSLLSNDVITLLIDGKSVTRCSSMLQDNSIYMGTVAGLEKDPNPFYLGIFQLLSRLFGKPELEACRAAIDKTHSVFTTNTDPALWGTEDARELEERYNAHEDGKIARQRTRAKNSLFALSASSEEELVTEVLLKSVSKTAATVIDTAEITEVLRATYQQDYYAKLPRLFSEETAAIADTFVNVAILKEEVVKDKESKLDTLQEKEDEQANDTEIQDNRLESHERLYEVHETTAIGALFAPLSDTRSPRKLLLYGRAGIGKTVLCQYVANQWAEKSDHVSCFNQFQAVFWIQLRELLDRLEDRRKDNRRIHREMLVAEMVTACCLRDSAWQEKIKKQQLHLWLKANAESTLFILDGYDEIAETAATPCVLSDCLGAVLNETRYKPHVMLTSRPVTIDRQYGSFDRSLECMGFIDENIPIFVSRYISELQQSNDCLTFLKAHPNIWGIAHVPIHLELICWLWSRGDLSLRSEQSLTITALYIEIVEKIGRTNYNKHSLLKETCLYKRYDKESPTTNTIVHFANDFLSFISFHAMQQEGVLLPGKKIKVWAQKFIRKNEALQTDKTEFDTERLLMACLHLGLLKSTRQGGKDLFDHTYYFIHLSFQEFFAAKYYQQAFECYDTKVIEHFRVHKYTPSYQLTWWMSAGLLYQHKNDSGLRAFFETLTTQPLLDLIGIHHANLLSNCLDECQADEKVQVVAQLTQHLAGFLQHLLERNWLANTWGKTLLHCPNLLRAKSFQGTGLDLCKKYQQMRFIPSNIAALLSHLITQEAIACLTNQAIHKAFRAALAEALFQRSDLTAEQVQSLIACVTDTTINKQVRKRLAQAFAQALARRSDLTTRQAQSLVACVIDTTLNSCTRVGVAKALAQRSDLTAEQVQSLFDCLTDTTINKQVRKGLVQALIQLSDLTAEQMQLLFACLTDTTLDSCTRVGVAKALGQRSNLTAEQVQSLFDCLTDTTINKQVRKGLAQALIQLSDLTAEQMQLLFACLTDTTLDDEVHAELAKALGQHSNLTAEQVQSLFAYLTDPTINYRVRKKLAKALVQRSDLTAKQVQSLFAYLTDTTIDGWTRVELAKALAQRSGLTAEQVQSLFACLTDTTIYGGIRNRLAKVLVQLYNLTAEQMQYLLACVTKPLDDKARAELAKALAQRPNLTAEQVQSLLACVTGTTLDDWVRVELAQALAQRSDLTTEQVQSLLACLTDTTLDDWVRLELAQALAQHSNLTAEQMQSLFACLTDTTINGWVRKGLAKALVQLSGLTAKQIQSLFACLTDPTLDNGVRVELAQALAQRSNLTAEQVQSLFDCLTDTTINGWVRKGLAKALVQLSGLTAEQVQSLFACLTDTTIDGWTRIELAKALAQHSNLTAEQMQYLLACLTDTTLDDEVRKGLAKALVQHSGLTAEQMQYLLACLTDTTLDDRVRKGLAKALVQRSNLTAEQIQSLFACLTDTALSYEIRKVLAQYSKFNVQQSQQVLVYCLKNEMICTRYPSLIFSILRNYYSTNQIEQYTVLPGLSTFLTRPSTWSALAKQQALFLYDEVNGIALLRLGTQTMEIPLQLSHNLFLPLSHKAWGGNIHPIDVRISKQKTENYPLLQTIECTLLSGQEIVTTTMMLSPALASPMKLTQGLKNLMEDSMSITKQYCFQLKRVNAFLLTITFISSNESSRAEGRRLSTLQKEMEACLQTANIKNYECKLKGKEEEILKVTGDKEVIDALADMLVRQGLPMALAEVNKYNAFFKAQKTSETDDMYILTCPMQ